MVSLVEHFSTARSHGSLSVSSCSKTAPRRAGLRAFSSGTMRMARWQLRRLRSNQRRNGEFGQHLRERQSFAAELLTGEKIPPLALQFQGGVLPAGANRREPHPGTEARHDNRDLRVL